MKKQTVFGQWMGSYKARFPREICALQAADLFAYELTKEFENLLSRPKDDMRWALRQILPLEGEKPLLRFYDAHEMFRIFLEATGQDTNPSAGIADILTETWLRKIAVRDLLQARIRKLTNPG
jgi:hypothetical protein